MRAVIFEDFGSDPVLAELPVPEPGPGELLVRIRAAGMNPFDWKVGEGALRGAVEHTFPLVMGSDGAGEVVGVGAGVVGFRTGDRVYGQFMRVQQGRGSYAEYALVEDGDKVALVPGGLSFTLAAALPTASSTAYQTIDAAALEPGQTILVNGASGGVGQSAVQVAAGRGAEVVATAPEPMVAHLRDLGAAHVVDFTVAPTAEQVRATHPDGVHAVLDLVTASAGPNPLADLLRPGGVLVSTNGAADPEGLAERGLRGVNFYNQVTRADLEALAALASAGGLRVTIDAEVTLAEAPAAVARARAGQATGKTVIVP